MRFGFLLKRGKPAARELATKLAQVLSARGCTLLALADDVGAVPGAAVVSDDRLGASIDALVVLGGDGTFLYGASLVADHGVPIFGVNLGSLGFITPYARSETAAAIEDLVAGRLPVEERIRLAVTIRSVLGPAIQSAPPEGFPNPPAMVRGEQSSPAPHAMDMPTRSAVNDAVLTQRSICLLYTYDA